MPADAMGFQKRIGYTGYRRPRGPGRGNPPYRMSRAAYEARLNNLNKRGAEGLRTWEESRRLELEIALWTHRPEPERESLRGLAKRLGCSHVYCWKVARRYRAGLIPSVPRDEQGLVALRDSLGLAPTVAETDRYHGAAIPGHTPTCECASCCVERAVAPYPATRPAELQPAAPAPQPRASDQPPAMAVEESIAEMRRIYEEEKRNNPTDGRLRTLQEWQELERRGRRRVEQGISGWLPKTSPRR